MRGEEWEEFTEKVRKRGKGGICIM